ncbi:ABC transporter permease subunit [Mediterraneibacter glycyrrhizinilyticus]|nr:ABC transporter permease subunit [Mediterraneibacter glycyrrhizinilyticus]MBM6855861.1 ABC transporter permease subunit [Mediterraneibacter glycyrrhizinilyticus]
MKEKKKKLPYIILIFAVIFLMLPFIATLVYSFTVGWTSLIPSDWTLKYWVQALTEPEIWPAIGRGLLISIPPILICNVVVILALYTAVIHYEWMEKIIQTICMIPNSLKGIIIAIPVLSLYAGSPSILGNRMVMLVCIYCISILPFVYQGIRNNLHGINVKQLIEAAEILGAGKLYAFCRIILPNMMAGILVSSLISLSSIFGDFTILKIIVGNRYETIQMLLYNSRLIVLQYQCVIVVITFVVTWILSQIIFKLQNRKKKR